MSSKLSKSLSQLSLQNTSPDVVYYMLGRFQPFTMGHLALFNNMVQEASTEAGRHAYLFVSHKKPNFSRSKVGDLETALSKKSPSMKEVKALMKKDKSIMDNPLSTLVRFQIVLMLMKQVYKPKVIETREETVFTLDKVLDINKMFKTNKLKSSMIKLDNPVEVHVVNSEVTNTGGFKAHGFLKKKYGKVPARMYTGTNREGRLAPFIMANKPIFIKREEGDTSDAFHPSGLSGSKIRSWSVIYFKNGDKSTLDNISKSYYGVLSDSRIEKYIINPISNSIFSGQMVNSISNNSSSSASSSSSSSSTASESSYRTSLSSETESVRSASKSVSASGKTKKKERSPKNKEYGPKQSKRRKRKFTLKSIND